MTESNKLANETTNYLTVPKYPLFTNPVYMNIFQKLFTLVFCFFLLSTLNAQSSLRKANKQYELYAFNLAIKSYKKVLDRHPNNTEALGRIADCYRHLNQMEEAATYYDKAVRQSKVDDLFFYQYGLVLKALGRYDEAKQWFIRFAEKYPVNGNQFAESCDFARARQHDPPTFEVKPEFLNSAAADFGPMYFEEGQIIYVSGRSDLSRSNKKKSEFVGTPNNQLMLTRSDLNGFLKEPTLLLGTSGNPTNQGPLAYSPDGKFAVITKNNFVDGTRQIPSSGLEMSLHISEISADGNFASQIPFPYNGSGYSTGYPSFSADGNSLYFASDRPDGFGGFDLYVSFRVGNSWSAPENLGSAVNTQGNEISPFVTDNTLFFASDWHIGFGGFDVFQANQSNGRWTSVSHAGTGINSSRDDFGMIFNAETRKGYFVSNRLGGKGSEDIYQVNMESNDMVINVINSISGEAIDNARLDFTSCGQGVFRTNQNGMFRWAILDGVDCAPVVTKEGYISKTFRITEISQKNIEVFLTKEGEAFRGRVVNANTGTILEGVNVRATNLATNHNLEAFSNINGEYNLAIEPDKTYVMRFSKVGYQELNWTITTSGFDNDRVLQTVSLRPSGTNIVDNSTPNNNAGNNSDGSNSGNSNSGNSSVAAGFAVQIAALSAGKNVDLTEFSNKVGSIGNVYAQPIGGKNKIRVGTFQSRAEADKAKKQLRSKGFNGCFVVTQEATGNTNEVVNNTSGSNSDSTAGNNPSTSEGFLGSNPEGFLVRLGAFKNPKSFDKNKVVDIGIVHSYEKGDWTIMLLAGYDTKAMAERALRKAKERGFKGAFLVKSEGGSLIKAN